MKLTNGEIYSAYIALDRLSTEKLPIRVSFGLAKISVKLEPIFRAIEKVRIASLKKYGVESQGNWTIVGATKENRECFEAELEELFGQKVDMGEIAKLKFPEVIASTCDQCHHLMNRPLEIAPSILVALNRFIEV